jgi:hypothetical protein
VRRWILPWVLLGCDCAYFFPSCQTAPKCPVGYTQCSNQVCSNLITDSANCGGCFNVCPPGLLCGPVGDGGAACFCTTAGAVPIQGACVDLPSDPSNCGQVGYHCDPQADCQLGQCICPDGTVQPDGGFCPLFDGGGLQDAGDAGDAGLEDAGDAGLDAGGDAGDGG